MSDKDAVKKPVLTLQRALRGREYFTIAFGSMVGVGWMTVMDDWLYGGGPGGAMLGFLIGGLALLPIGYVYGRLTERMPDAGGEVAYARSVFPRGVSFAAGWAMTLAYLIVCPFEAVSLGLISSYVFPQLNSLSYRYPFGGQLMYVPHVILGLLITLIIASINYRGVKTTAKFQNWTTFLLLAIISVFVAAGITRGKAENLQPLFQSHGSNMNGLLSTLIVLQIVPFFMLGFETVPKCSEEASINFSPRRFINVIFSAIIVGTVFYVLVILLVAWLHPWGKLVPSELGDKKYAMAVAIERAFGSNLPVKAIMLGVFFSLLKVFNGNFLTATRLIYAMGRRRLLSPQFRKVNERYQTPQLAIIFVAGFTAFASLFGRAVLVPISDIGSLACALGWFATCLAFCFGAGGAATSRTLPIGICATVISAAFVIMKFLPSRVFGGLGAAHYAVIAIWAALGFVMWSWRPKDIETTDQESIA